LQNTSVSKQLAASIFKVLAIHSSFTAHTPQMDKASCFEKKARQRFTNKHDAISQNNTSSISGAHPKYYIMDTGGPFSGGKATEA
jgi:hypothetical protein